MPCKSKFNWLKTLSLLIFVSFARIFAHKVSLRCRQRYAKSAYISGLPGTERLGKMAVLNPEFTVDVSQQIVERADKRIQNSLDLLRAHLERCHQKTPESAAVADDLSEILVLLNELSELRHTRKVPEIAEKIEQIIEKAHQFRANHKKFAPDNIYNEILSAINFCKEQIERVERFKRIHKTLEAPSELPKDIEAYLETITESLEDLAGILDEDSDFFGKEALVILRELSFIILKKSESELTNKESRRDTKRTKLWQRQKFAAYFMLSRTQEIDPFIHTSKEMETLSPWDTPPPPTESMKKTIAIMKKRMGQSNSWSVRPLNG